MADEHDGRKKSNSSSVMLELIALLERFFKVCTENKEDEKISKIISSMLEKATIKEGEVMRFSFPDNIKKGLLMKEYYEVDLTSNTLSIALRNVLVQHLILTKLILEHKIVGSMCLNVHSHESVCLNDLFNKAKKVILKSGEGCFLKKAKISLINGILNLRVKLSNGETMTFKDCKTDEELLEHLKQSLLK